MDLQMLWKDEQAHPITLLRAVLKQYGPEAMDWEPEVFKPTLESDFKTSVARINLAKLWAVVALANRDKFWTDWQTFHFLAQALNNNVPVADHVQDLTIGQMMVAVEIANGVRDELRGLRPIPKFSEEVARFIAAQAALSGVWYLPAPLAFANHLASGQTFQCKDCGHEDDTGFEDGFCPVCVDTFNTDSLADFKPDAARVAKGFGKNVQVKVKHPTDAVEKRLFQAQVSQKQVLEENMVDICAAKLLVALNYLDYRRSQFAQQQEKV
jgi:hypothetical protein